MAGKDKNPGEKKEIVIDGKDGPITIDDSNGTYSRLHDSSAGAPLDFDERLKHPEKTPLTGDEVRERSEKEIRQQRMQEANGALPKVRNFTQEELQKNFSIDKLDGSVSEGKHSGKSAPSASNTVIDDSNGTYGRLRDASAGTPLDFDERLKHRDQTPLTGDEVRERSDRQIRQQHTQQFLDDLPKVAEGKRTSNMSADFKAVDLSGAFTAAVHQRPTELVLKEQPVMSQAVQSTFKKNDFSLN